jgi:hypothetical protein
MRKMRSGQIFLTFKRSISTKNGKKSWAKFKGKIFFFTTDNTGYWFKLPVAAWSKVEQG